MFGFLQIGLIDIIDIILVGVIIFYMFRLLKGSQAMSIFIAIMALVAMRIFCNIFNMRLMTTLLGAILDVGLVALIVIFQPEIRRFLSSMGNSYRLAGQKVGWLSRILGTKAKSGSARTIDEIASACKVMSEEKCGALIVLQKKISLQYVIETGDIVDAAVSQRLLRNLFFKNSPLHDGAVIIGGDRVLAARCTLPNTEREMPASFGMRHKAAMGVTETSDALVIVVSEETGGISVMQDGKATSVKSINMLKNILKDA